MPEAPPVPDRSRIPLLTLITQESLDQDYQHVAQQRAAERSRQGADATDGHEGRRGRWTAAVVVGAFGLIVTVAAVQTSARAGVDSANRASLLEQIADRRELSTDLQTRMVRLRESTIGQQDAYDQAAAAERTLTNRVNRYAAQSGFGAVTGPGIVITVDDAPNGEAVSAQDLSLLVNGLWEGGAEAISINGKRLTARSALFNSGVAVNLGSAPPLSPPYVVSAIGDNRTLEANLIDTSTGLAFRNTADALGFEFTIDRVDELKLPAAPMRQPRHAVKGTADDNRRPDGKETAP